MGCGLRGFPRLRSLAMVSRSPLPVLPPGAIAMPLGLRMQGGQFGARALRIMARNWPAHFYAGWAALRCLLQVPGIESGGGLANKLLQLPPDTHISRAQGAGDGRDGIAKRGRALRKRSMARTELPRVYRRVICSTTRRPYRGSSGLHGTHPLLLRG